MFQRYASILLLFILLPIGGVLYTSTHAVMAQNDLLERVRVEQRQVRKKLKKAERLKAKGYVGESAKVYVNILKDHPGSAVKQKKDHLFKGVSALVRNRISSWKEEDQSVVQNLFRGEAQSQLQKAESSRDQKLLKRVALTYFFTGQGRSAARELARRRYKEGRLSSAVFWWNHLLKHHPEMNDAEHIRNRLASALRVIDADQFHSLRTTLEEIDVQRSSNDLSDAQQMKPGRTVYDWPRPGGNRTGTGRVPSHIEQYRPGKSSDLAKSFIHLWSFPNSESDSTLSRTTPIDLDKSKLEDYTYSPIQPIVYNDTLYVHDSSNVFAFDIKETLVSGRNLRKHLRWSYPSGRQNMDAQAIKEIYNRGLGAISLAAYDGHLYFVRRKQHTLHRIEAGTGKPVFQTQAPEVDGDQLQFNGTPLVTDQGVFVPLVRMLHDDIDMFLARYEKKDGTLDWIRLVGSSLNTERYERNSNQNTRTYSHLLSTGNRIFFATNMSLVASVNSVTGEIDWVHNYSAYNRFKEGGENESNQRETDANWEGHPARGTKPPRILNGQLYVLPRNHPGFFSFDVGTGKLLLKRHMPDTIRLMDLGSEFSIVKNPAAYFLQKGERAHVLKLRSLHPKETEEKTDRKDLTRKFSQLPSVSPGEKQLILGRKREVWGFERTNPYLMFSQKWPWSSTLKPHEMIATGNRIILVGPGGIMVLTTVDELEREVGEIVRKHLFPFDFTFE